MSSFTSSSSEPRPSGGIYTLLRVAYAPTALVVAVVLLIGSLWYRWSPCEPYVSPDDVTVATQLRRSKTAPPADVLVIGDSSSGADVDPVALEAMLGKRVQSLSIQGWGGPAAFAKLLDNYAAHVKSIPTLVILIHPDSLRASESSFWRAGVEHWVSKEDPADPIIPGSAARMQLFERVIAPMVDFPLPGKGGAVYGWPSDFGRAIETQHGSTADDRTFKKFATARPFAFTVTPAVESRLPALEAAIARACPERVVFALTPLPEALAGDHVSRDRLVTRIGQDLRLEPESPEALPATYPEDLFATLTHLNPMGRSAYTKALASVLLSASTTVVRCSAGR